MTKEQAKTILAAIQGGTATKEQKKLAKQAFEVVLSTAISRPVQ